MGQDAPFPDSPHCVGTDGDGVGMCEGDGLKVATADSDRVAVTVFVPDADESTIVHAP